MTPPALGPMGYLAKPVAMGSLVSGLFEARLLEYGIRHARVSLMAVYAEDRITSELTALERRPADQAMGIALGIAAQAWDEAMTVHGMFRQAIDRCQRQVRLELEEVMDEHVKLVRERAEARTPALDPQVEAEHAQAEEDEQMYALMRTSGVDPTPQRRPSP